MPEFDTPQKHNDSVICIEGYVVFSHKCLSEYNFPEDKDVKLKFNYHCWVGCPQPSWHFAGRYVPA